MTNDEAHQPTHSAHHEAAQQHLSVPAWRRMAVKGMLLAGMSASRPSSLAPSREVVEHRPEVPLPSFEARRIESDSLGRSVVSALREADAVIQESDNLTKQTAQTAATYAVELGPSDAEAKNLETYEQALTNWRQHEAVRIDAESQAYQEINILRQTLGGLPSWLKHEIDRDVEARLSRVPSALIRKKIATEATLNRDVPWADMLAEAESPYAHGHGFDDQELVDFLEWSLADAEQEAKDPEQHALHEADRKRYLKDLRASVGDGPDDLHPNLLRRIEHIRQTKVLPSSVLNRFFLAGNLGYAHMGDNIVVFPPDATHHTKSHEFTHNAVNFGHVMLNEAIVETIALRTVPDEPDLGIYGGERKVLQSIMEVSDLSLRDITGLNVADNPVESERQLSEAVRQRTGLDIIGFVTDLYNQSYQLRPSAEISQSPALASRNALRPVRQALLIVEFMLPNGRLATTDLQQRVAGVEKVIAGLEKDGDQEMADAARQGLKLCLSSLPTL